MKPTFSFAPVFFGLVHGQQVGTQTAENHPAMTWQTCTSPSSCTTNNGMVVVDANWRWLHSTSSTTNCYTGNTWDTTLCPDDVTCAANCALDGADYSGTYGVTTSGSSLSLNFITHGSSGTNVGVRLYMMETDTSYQIFNLLNQEFSFDVDVSNLPCGLNGALYLTSMDADGGMAKYPTNKAGAKYGTGYCDSQCPRDLKMINGQGNVEGWVPSSTDANAGTGNHGSCCSELDIWEANSISTALTPHPCSPIGQTMCETDDCGGTYSATRYGSYCDPDGCDFNPYRQGNTSFYGPHEIVDTTSKFTVVTQFVGNPLTQINRFYIQNGQVIPNSQSDISGVTGNSITEAYCKAQKSVFDNTDVFDTFGGFSGISSALAGGMTLVMSVWDDHYANMNWLDSTYPSGSTGPGSARGTCSTTAGAPTTVEQGSASVTFSNIKVGAIGSTYAGTGTGSSGGTGTGSGGGSAASSTSSSGGTSNTAGAAAGFVTTSGTNFMLNGKPFDFVGTNAYWATGLVSEDLTSLFSQMNAAGLKVLRIFGWGDNVGGPEDSSFQYWSGSNNTPNPAAFAAHMDPIISGAEAAGIRLVIPMIGNWGASISLYIQQIVGSSGTHDTFYSNSQIVNAYKTYVNFFVNRYKNSPAIFAWELMNEPGCTGDDGRGASSACDYAMITNWAKDISAYIKGLDSLHMVTMGDEGWFTAAQGYGPPYSTGIDWVTNLQISTLDYGTVHLYPSSWGTTDDWGNGWITHHAEHAATIGKPVVLEEFGTSASNRYNVVNEWLNSAYSSGYSGIQYWQFVSTFPSGYTSPDDGNGISTTEATFSLIKAMAAEMNAKGPGGTSSGGSTSSASSASSASSTSTTSASTSTTSTSSGGTVAHWGQCGGIGWTGGTVCASPYTCQVGNPYYSQCL